ncbi:MAG: lipoprotein [Pseudomonadota bacterium]
MLRLTHIMRVLAFLLPAVLVAALGACGYKGPLYLPKPKPETQSAEPAPAQDRQKSGVPDPSRP